LGSFWNLGIAVQQLVSIFQMKVSSGQVRTLAGSVRMSDVVVEWRLFADYIQVEQKRLHQIACKPRIKINQYLWLPFFLR
jgi:hypothetical protein